MEDNGQAIIVYGASTSVGVFVTQFAKRAGFFVVGVAGASSDYAKSFGADVIVDYRGKSMSCRDPPGLSMTPLHGPDPLTRSTRGSPRLSRAFGTSGLVPPFIFPLSS